MNGWKDGKCDEKDKKKRYGDALKYDNILVQEVLRTRMG